ncbi:hypothetical protein SAMN05216330_112143 [Bradyrhizobium sp. Ghvi]|uniref:hypothetical protein n=1 Tax=Bradyrhizobium sp. Ghvi TaxID=1855319 RepID=UPI0008E636D0|nr:hypothetical protein [Bradyrhizobium sp. Ghvi]SFP94855.1 hypothetical protein SAMN05216330_112143 [Bradyrhizobium sp. Ghvi]
MPNDHTRRAAEVENALTTGNYVITTYQCSAAVKKDEVKINDVTFECWRRADGIEVCLVDHPAGDWWYSLNDGCLDVGPFASEAAAVEEATQSLEHYRRVMGGKVLSVDIH